MLKHVESKKERSLFLQFLRLLLSRSKYKNLSGIHLIFVVRLDIGLQTVMSSMTCKICLRTKE
jgi:hypothetical protein